MVDLKKIAFGLYLAGGYADVARRIGSLGLSPELFFYFGLFGLVSLSLLACAYIRNGYLRWSGAIALSGSALFLGATERVLGDHLTYDLFVTLLESAGAAGEAWSQYGYSIAISLPGALLLLLAVGLRPRPQPPSQLVVGGAALGGLVLLSLLLFVRGGEGARGLPTAATPVAYGALYLYEEATSSVEARENVQIAHPGQGASGDLVLIVDESVLGTELDINSPRGVRSGLAEPRAGLNIFNYGLAAAITHCSVGANVTLRFGGTRRDYQRINGRMPSIWKYAKQAGFRTAYVDAQRTGGELHGLMTSEELRDVDRFVQFDRVPVRDRDMAIADTLAELLGNGQRELILVNKMGAHFPVHDKYPDQFMRYRPALPRGRYMNIGDTGSRAGFAGTETDWIRYRNSYRNTLLWNVGAFFDRLFARADLSHATIVYTSDHGQNLHRRGERGDNTHCSPDPIEEEGIVPLVVIQGKKTNAGDWSRNLAWNRGRSSDYQIFPTLLGLMGYDERQVTGLYGESLLMESHDPLTFNTLFNARLGRQPVWKSIRPVNT